MNNRIIPEPIPDHLADTGRMRPIRTTSPLMRAFGLLALLIAAGLTAATAAVVLLPIPQPLVSETVNTQMVADSAPTAVIATPNEILPTAPPLPTDNAAAAAVTSAELDSASALSSEGLTALLNAPIAVHRTTFGFEIARSDYSAFTIIPDRPRSEVIQYEVQQGDTIFRIAERFGIEPETIAWANDRSLIGRLRPGRRVNIMPINGVYHSILTETSIAEIAAQYAVDPYAIIDSEYNNLFGATPDTTLTTGAKLVIPGGTAEQIVWNPVVERVGGDANGAGGQIAFSPGDPGSCGLVDNPGGGGGWVRPLGGYTWTQGFSSIHTGVDLSASEGAPVMAANGGTVIFAGWNNYGYGYLVVLAHGPFTTVYGHLSSYNARCGSYVSAGQVIGGVGSTGQSTGNHLHFEIRYNDVPQNPTSVMPL
ncbi:MAG: M23 family metallopeptidase [Chloroflexota bacterium]|nr:M23 family metallopeptidase [Chloroflexota bacterium]